MIILELHSVDKWYDLEQPEARVLLRDQLKDMGFFELDDNQITYPWFTWVMIQPKDFLSLMSRIVFFDQSMMPSHKKRLQ